MLKGEIDDLIVEHWEETKYQEFDLNLYWDKYITLEEQGLLTVFTMRVDGVLAGYIVFLVHKSLHHQGYLAVCDGMFIKSVHRKGFNAINLLKFAEKCLCDDGVRSVTINSHHERDISPLLVFSGYDAVETVFSKEL